MILIGFAFASITTWTQEIAIKVDCPDRHFMTSMIRGYKETEFTELIRAVVCKTADNTLVEDCPANDCYTYKRPYDERLSSINCKDGYFLTSMQSYEGAALINIENFQCCKPKSKNLVQSNCKKLERVTDVKCEAGFYIKKVFHREIDLICCQLLKPQVYTIHSGFAVTRTGAIGVFDSNCTADHLLAGKLYSLNQIQDLL